MDEPVMKRLERAVRILSEQYVRGSSSSSNEVENSKDASTSVVGSKDLSNNHNGQGSNSNNHNEKLLPVDSNEQILRFYSDIEGV